MSVTDKDANLIFSESRKLERKTSFSGPVEDKPVFPEEKKLGRTADRL